MRFSPRCATVFIIIMLTALSCDDESRLDQIRSVCALIENNEIMTDEERSETCEYLNLYLYEGNYYQTCTCCLCNKLSNPIDCNGEPFCIGDIKACLDRFYDEAEYLFSMPL